MLARSARVASRTVAGQKWVFHGARAMSTKGDVITPKQEFSGTHEVSFGHDMDKRREVTFPWASTDKPIGTEDAPWTPKSAIGKTPAELIAEVPPIPVNGARVSCDGGPDPARGHPTVYFNLDGPKPKTCNYCGLRYFNANKHH